MKTPRSKVWPLSLALILISGMAVAGPETRRAPAIRSSTWFNSRALGEGDLRGKVVLVEFWAFACINCQRTVPAMRTLQATYPDVVVIGVHTPELDRERDPANVAAAVKRLDLRFPVALDNDYAIWRAFGNQYWPALYLIDKRGQIRTTHVGELHEGTVTWTALRDLIDRLRREPA